MSSKFPRINVDILVIKKNKILLGLLSKKWLGNKRQVYGVPGRDIYFNQTIGDAIKGSLKEEVGCKTKKYKIICVNANYEFGNHYVGVGAVAEIDGKVKLLRPDEWSKWEWFDRNKLPINLFPAAKNLIECYLTNKFNVAE
jgi:ADP-ribose pyrophosphatase YjhB (NUDIX family)